MLMGELRFNPIYEGDTPTLEDQEERELALEEEIEVAFDSISWREGIIRF